MLSKSIAILLALSRIVTSNFTADFSAFLEETYGSEMREQLERLDLEAYGAFGGKTNRNDSLINQPLIIVHGVSDTAGEKPLWAAAWFRQNASYKNNEIYATTYANGSEGDALKWLSYSMKCEYVKQIRNLAIAVNEYTSMKIDILAYSLGVPIARKAILGGECVDTSEDLGEKLTDIVDSFVAVAGPNHGSSWCGLAIPTICNSNTGLYGGCFGESKFLENINEESHYEGEYTYTIYSESDMKVGYKVCGTKTSPLENQDGEKVYSGLSHDEVFEDTYDSQVSMFRDHIAE